MREENLTPFKPFKGPLTILQLMSLFALLGISVAVAYEFLM